MLQIDHIYEFFYENLFKDFIMISAPGGIFPKNFIESLRVHTEESNNDPINVFLQTDEVKKISTTLKQRAEDISEPNTYSHNSILFYDQEPVNQTELLPFVDTLSYPPQHQATIVTSEKSQDANIWPQRKINILYYFFHGFAALDWYRGYYAMNYTQPVIKDYKYNFITFNRIVTGDRAYRKTFVDKLKENNLTNQGLISYGVVDEPETDDRLVIDQSQVSASASADILRTIDSNSCPDYSAFWHIVTETVFYYDKLHLTEKIFKPIVSKQPFMLLAAPGNLAYLKSYGFKTFDSVIDESYDLIQDDNERIDAVVAQMKWYCNLSQEEKSRVIERLAPIVEYNFQHFYGKFKEIITDELLDNTKTLFHNLKYDDSHIDYATVRKLLTS